MNPERVKRRITRARTRLLLERPFFGYLALHLKTEIDPTILTACTDGKRIRYNPAFVARLSDRELMGLVAHEVMHPAHEHHLRMAGRNPERWNVACDYAINPLVKRAGLALPEGVLLDKAYRGMNAERIYKLLPEELSGKERAAAGWGGVEAPEMAEGADGSQETVESEAKKWATRLMNAAAADPGRVPGPLKRRIETLRSPPADWRSLLRRFIDRANPSDWSWRAPAPWHLSQGLYLPRWAKPKLSHLAVAIDTSGSTGSILNYFIAELSNILRSFPACVTTLIQCDSRVREAQTFTARELPLTITVQGGGGTDFNPVFAHLADKPAPGGLVFFSDLQANRDRYPAAAPGYPVLWVEYPLHGQYESERYGRPPFGEHVRLTAS